MFPPELTTKFLSESNTADEGVLLWGSEAKV